MSLPFMKNRAFQVKVVKDQTEENEPKYDPYVGPMVAAAYSDVAKDLITHAALTIGGVWAACKIIERICK